MSWRIDRRTATARWLGRLFGCLLLGAGALGATAQATQADTWAALFAAVPALPATPAEAAKMISARTVLSEGLGIAQLRIEIADPRLRGLQQQVGQLYEPIVQAGTAQMQRVMEAVNKDPLLTELARKIDQTWKPNPAHPVQLPSPEAIRQLDREIERVLGPMPSAASAAAAPHSEIEAYRRELQGATPRASQFLQRLADQQRQYAKSHAQADREATAQLPGGDAASVARAALARHNALAQQQLADAAAIVREARDALAPRVRRLTELARAAEQRNAPAHERNQAHVLVKAYIEFMLTLHRETLQDVGFWAGMRMALPLPEPAQAGARGLYEQSLAPGFDLRANGEMPYGLPLSYYPLGRAIVVGLPPGIR